jgi:uncharacterized protein (DUF2141 family)
MFKTLSNLMALIVMVLLLANCANRGNPSGGEKDTTPPEITRSDPENYSVNFDAEEIRIYFDEYIKIKDIQKQLIISPPMNPEPEITPLGGASKYITIKIYDTLQPNTTYALNFGESIVDNNEENPYPYYRYVFSTGSYIDSLQVTGEISDALNRVPDEFVSVLLYEVDSTFTDSIIYKQKPKYITNTLDSLTTFQLDNLSKGTYLMLALKEENPNYTFQQKTDKIGFLKDFITVPKDTTYSLKLFAEEIDFKASRPVLTASNKIAFGFEGNPADMRIELISEQPDDFVNQITKDPEADSLIYWYKPKIEADSLLFLVSHGSSVDTLQVRLRNLAEDSLVIKPSQSRTLTFTEDWELEANIPFPDINTEYISIMRKDSTLVDYTTSFDPYLNKHSFFFEKEEQEIYRVQMLPEAFTDFFGNKNDTLNYGLNTKTYDDYGNVRVTLRNTVYPVIVQLTDGQGEMQYEQYSEAPEVLDFRHLKPASYYLRVIFDANGNKKYDAGNYLQKREPERVSYFPELLDVRAGWDLIQEFILQ